jgi:2,4-dienoyl-CoA reductase-like NADH-dependent reductase (Old Yellow Enzyme family)
VAKEVHAAGGKIAPQIWHQGMMRKPGTGPVPEGKSDGPSGLSASGKQVAEPMTDADIADTVEAFARAAGLAKDIGFDAVELHGAHGYLVDQFFWDKSNCCSCRRRTRSVYSPNAGSSTRYRVRSSSFRKAA